MVDILTIEKINDFVEKRCPDLSRAEKLYCFNKLYSSFGSMSYDTSNTEIMNQILDNCLQEIKPTKKIKTRVFIWAPRYKDDVCLVAKFRVPDEPFEIVFTKAIHLANILFEVDGKYVKEHCVLDSNGKTPCYAIPMEILQNKGMIEPSLTPMEMER